jgi:serine/threonine protein kinase
MSDELDIAANLGGLPERQQKWDDACDRYLPLIDDDSIWRYNRPGNKSDLDQGWKLHVSATILNATEVLTRIAPKLSEHGVQFKAPRSLNEVLKLNGGLHGAYSQVGKIITVYPRHDDEAVQMARILHQLTYRFRAPSVPFDLRFGHTSNIYYRYGAFKKQELKHQGALQPAVMSPNGELVPDVRESPKPDWVSDPFENIGRADQPGKLNDKNVSSFLVVRALVQRGKGGVYQAIDTQSQPPRFCLLKEGRRHGELSWDGRDGAWRVRHEERVLSALSRSGMRVPKVYSRFEVAGNVYLAIEFIEGDSLYTRLIRRQRRLSIESILDFGIQIAGFLEEMHRAGWAWRDCKPSNLLVTANGRLVPIDFEGAEHVDRPDPLPWGTPGFVPEPRDQNGARGLTDDLFALGSVLFFLTTGHMFDEAQPISIERLRRHVPLELRQLVESLLDINPRKRPSAQNIHNKLKVIFQNRQRLAEASAA